ncbi:MAG: endolytic transglycosylase MltG [Bacilli bacterium]
MTKKIIIPIIIVFISLLVGGAFYYYSSNLEPVNTKNKKVTEEDKKNVLFEVNIGESASTIINNLYDANLINNKNTVYIYYKMNGDINIQAGTYLLNRNMSVQEIMTKFKNGDVEESVVKLTFLEGYTIPKYVSIIAKEYDFTEKEIYDKINNVAYLKQLINKYWFLTDDILKDGIYYPLEGYLYPDTYIFDRKFTITQIIEKILDNTALKLEPYKEELTAEGKYSIHDYLTMASIIEHEGKTKEDREMISQVIRYRLKDNWALGMDVTAYYGVKKELTDVIYQTDLDDKNPYNTRLNDGSMNGKLPIGPINNPHIESIDAAIHPADTEYYWFVANVCTGEVFFQKDAIEFSRKCNELKTVCELN